MAFYLEGTYIDDAYLRKKILDNDQVSIEKNNNSYKKNENIFKKIGVEIEDVKYEDLLSILERQFSDDELDEYSALLNLNKTHSQKFFRIAKEFQTSTHSQSNTVQICGKNKTGLLI